MAMIWPYLGLSARTFSNLGINPKESLMFALASDIPSKRTFSIITSSVVIGLVATSILVLGGASPASSATVACSTTVIAFEEEGDSEDPFRIDNAADLIFLSTMPDDEYNYGAYFVQTANIDLGDCEFKPIGYIYDESEDEEFAFTGRYNGQGFTVSGLRITQTLISTPKIGLFGDVDDFYLSNLIVQGSISLPDSPNVHFVGGVIGESGESYISNVKSEVTIDAASGIAIGGIAGYINFGSIDRSVYKGALSTVSADGVGGLVGVADRVTVTSSYSISTFNTGVVGAGLFGQETCDDPPYVPDVSNTYVVGSGTTYGIQKANCGVFDSTFWNSSLSPNTATATDPLVGAVAKTTAQLKAFATYPASWNMVNGWDVFSASAPLKTWGICSSVNEGYPYLLWEYTTNPCVAQSPPPQAPAASTAPTTLATTGAEVEWLAIGSLIAVAAGAGFLALGRRKRA
jgi:hypothetical protein